MQPVTPQVCAASSMAVILQALMSHVQKHHNSGWTLAHTPTPAPQPCGCPEPITGGSLPGALSDDHSTSAARHSADGASAHGASSSTAHLDPGDADTDRRSSNGLASTSSSCQVLARIGPGLTSGCQCCLSAFVSPACMLSCSPFGLHLCCLSATSKPVSTWTCILALCGLHSGPCAYS